MPASSTPPLPSRLLAGAIDLALTFGIVGLGIYRESLTPFDGLFACLGLVIAGVFWLVRDTGRASPGKRIAGLMAERTDAPGRRLTAERSARRNAVYGAALILNGAGALLIADPFAQLLAALASGLGALLGLVVLVDAVSLFVGADGRLGDRWAGTRVVDAAAADVE